MNDRTRAFLKVQDGCDYNCSFCTIPLARGHSRSDSVAGVLANMRELVANGTREIVLTGINLGDFGKGADGGKTRDSSFYELIQAMDEQEGIDRIRISSIEPNLLSNEIIAFVARSKRFMPHFHIPLQSGSNKILGLMRRRYRRDLYTERVAYIKQLMPHCCIGVDVIVGFPGETEAEFRATYDFINSLDVSYLHVFTYSERANTKALNLSPIVPVAERKKRNEMLRILSEKKKRAFYEANLNTERPILWEIEKDGDTMYGFTDNYIKVGTPYDETIINTIQKATMSDIAGSGYVKVLMSSEVAAL